MKQKSKSNNERPEFPDDDSGNTADPIPQAGLG